MTPDTAARATVVHDPSRLAALRRYALLDTPAEQSFDRLTRLARRLLHAPVALVSLVDRDRQFFKSCVGLPEPWATRRETPLSHSFCQHAVEARAPLRIEDARRHPLVCDSPAIQDLGVIAYLGVPLITPLGYELGSMCVIDHEPRRWSDEDVEQLQELAAVVLTEIELRGRVAELEHAAADTPRRQRRAEARLHRIRARAEDAQSRLDQGNAALSDVALPPRDVLWLLERAEQRG